MEYTYETIGVIIGGKESDPSYRLLKSLVNFFGKVQSNEIYTGYDIKSFRYTIEPLRGSDRLVMTIQKIGETRRIELHGVSEQGNNEDRNKALSHLEAALRILSMKFGTEFFETLNNHFCLR